MSTLIKVSTNEAINQEDSSGARRDLALHSKEKSDTVVQGFSSKNHVPIKMKTRNDTTIMSRMYQELQTRLQESQEDEQNMAHMLLMHLMCDMESSPWQKHFSTLSYICQMMKVSLVEFLFWAYTYPPVRFTASGNFKMPPAPRIDGYQRNIIRGCWEILKKAVGAKKVTWML